MHWVSILHILSIRSNGVILRLTPPLFNIIYYTINTMIYMINDIISILINIILISIDINFIPISMYT